MTAVSEDNVTVMYAAVLFSARLIGPRVAVVLAAMALLAFVIIKQPACCVRHHRVLRYAIFVSATSDSRTVRHRTALADGCPSPGR
ncbi:hypothetical protein ABFA25_13420 [Mycobacterium lepromatosis]|nr:hypothetical protein [Mycobacterium lepromatosis]